MSVLRRRAIIFKDYIFNMYYLLLKKENFN